MTEQRNTKHVEVAVPPELGGERLDATLAKLRGELSRSHWRKLIESGSVSNGEHTVLLVPRRPVLAGELLIAEVPDFEAAATPAAEPFDFPILYEDGAILVIDKPAGVVVHPAPGNREGTIVNALLGRYPQLLEFDQIDRCRPGIVHRLDKDTSGCLIVAKTPEAQKALTDCFAAHDKVCKTYRAILLGVPERRSGEICTRIGRHPVDRQKMAVLPEGGKEAVSRYRITRTGKIGNVPVSLAEVGILTGRTHQIRVHMATVLRCPVLGDCVYGGGRRIPGIPRQMLHAWKLALPHPLTGEIMHFTAPVPDDFREVEAQIGEDSPRTGKGLIR
ncbi:MAG: RluA family pseudouridine synthase [Victivallaceae bacterium]|nr:RluA family pseudouridine synthase [Victivallaceae bacterium]